MSRKRGVSALVAVANRRHALAPVDHLGRVICRQGPRPLHVGLHEGFDPCAALGSIRVERLFSNGLDALRRLVVLFHGFLSLSFSRPLTDCSFLYQTHLTYMTGKELTDNLRCAISRREAAFTEGEYLRLDAEVRRIQRCIDRMRLEIHVRVGGKQLMLADVLDLRDSCVRLNMPRDVNYLDDLINQAMKIEFEP